MGPWSPRAKKPHSFIIVGAFKYHIFCINYLKPMILYQNMHEELNIHAFLPVKEIQE